MAMSMGSREWDAQAATFDSEPDHGLLDPNVRSAWVDLVMPLMPPAPASILDVGCGTGSLSVLFAQAGHDVHGIDFSERMVAAARAKADAAGVVARFAVDDAQAPSLEPASCDVVLGRHILWALPDPRAALRRWIALLREPGLLVLVEGRWSTGAGLTAVECERLVQPLRQEITITQLDDAALWGRPITDERYLVVSQT
jgi:SAM-dependent methyltransferase